jgi:hypothetical protein
MQGQWFYGVAANRLGPVPAPELQRLVQSGTVGPMTMVWTEGMPQWVAAGSLPFLYPAGMPPGMMQPDDGGALNLLMPIGPQSGFSIAAGYIGLISLVVCFIAPFAILFGVLGLRDIGRNPQKHGKGRAIVGLVCGAIGTCILIAVFALGLFFTHGPRR